MNNVEQLRRCARCLAVYFAHDGDIDKDECYVTEANLKRLKNGKSKKRVSIHLAYDDLGNWERGKLLTDGVPLCGIAESAIGKESAKLVPVWFVFSCGCGVDPIFSWLDVDHGGVVRDEGSVHAGRKYGYTDKKPKPSFDCNHTKSGESRLTEGGTDDEEY